MNIVEWVVAVLGSGGVFGGLGVLLTSRSHSRKAGAESTVMLVDSASKYATNLVDRINAISEAFDKYRREQDFRWRQQEQLFRRHARWDDEMADRLRDLGQDVTDPPPLYAEPIGETT